MPDPIPSNVAVPDSAPTRPAASARMASIDAYRGLVMFLMMAESLRLCEVSKALPASEFWRFLCYHQSHVEWVGCSLHDLIQPSFSFLVGVALPYSLAARRARGDSVGWLAVHAFWRAFLLVALGIFLRSVGKGQTNFTFEDTLTQIGLGYGVLFLLGLAQVRWQWGALVLILVGYWLAFTWYPLPGSDFDWSRAGVPQDWEHHASGLAAHWNKNTNLAWAFDTWFLNLFPREAPFEFNGGGYATLSFIPTLGTMILGLIAGGWLHDRAARAKLVPRLLVAGALALGLGWACHAAGICPNVKRIWTPTWVLFSGGWCFLLMAAFHLLLDRFRLWILFFPLLVIGMNSIAAYCMEALWGGFVHSALTRHLGSERFGVFGQPYEPLLHGAAALLVLWLILLWMYRRKLFLKI